MSNSFDVEIAHIRARTLMAVALATGALAQAVGSSLLLNAGLAPHGVPILNVMGVDMSTSTVAAIGLCTSALWAYLAYLARPKPEARLETKTGAARNEASLEINDFSLSVPPDTARASR
jgi:hypothetical protein